MASAACFSAHTLEQIVHHHHQYCSIPLICEEQLFESLQDKLSFLQAFLEDYSQNGGEPVEGLEGRTGAWLSSRRYLLNPMFGIQIMRTRLIGMEFKKSVYKQLDIHSKYTLKGQSQPLLP
ncbi:UNVERIFIED_CONTAM: hypothetical protein Sangu_0085100 [Sesamum angustifolium]|uniref:Uncharacterized protein n=1 Tax=Sesamum angustifolium TaxID=2727405 RepID=A0AAW2RL86_9LAMI